MKRILILGLGLWACSVAWLHAQPPEIPVLNPEHVTRAGYKLARITDCIVQDTAGWKQVQRQILVGCYSAMQLEVNAAGQKLRQTSCLEDQDSCTRREWVYRADGTLAEMRVQDAEGSHTTASYTWRGGQLLSVYRWVTREDDEGLFQHLPLDSTLYDYDLSGELLRIRTHRFNTKSQAHHSLEYARQEHILYEHSSDQRCDVQYELDPLTPRILRSTQRYPAFEIVSEYSYTSTGALASILRYRDGVFLSGEWHVYDPQGLPLRSLSAWADKTWHLQRYTYE